MAGKSDEESNILNGSPDSIRSIVSLQQERYHHIQSLSLGLISAFLTLVTVAVTGYSILRGEIPRIPLEEATISEITGGTLTLPMWSTTLVLIANYLLSWALVAISITMAVTALSNLIDIVTKDPLYNTINSPETHIVGRNAEYTSVLNLSTTYTEHLQDQIQKNQIKLDHVNDLFVSSVIRIVVCLLILFTPFYIRTLASNIELLEIIVLNALFVVPAPTKWIMSYLWAPESKSREVSRPRLSQELASEDNKGRWDFPDVSIWEKLLLGLVFGLSISSVLIGLLGFLL